MFQFLLSRSHNMLGEIPDFSRNYYEKHTISLEKEYVCENTYPFFESYFEKRLREIPDKNTPFRWANLNYTIEDHKNEPTQ